MKFNHKIIEKITLPFYLKRDGQPNLLNHFSFLNESQYWSREKLQEYKFVRLKKLLIHAYQNCPFYKNRFDNYGFDPLKFNDYSQFKKIPLLNKAEIQANYKSMIAQNYNSSQLHFSETGGTTGVKMKFYRDNACLSYKEAALYRFDNWGGWNIGDYYGLVWPATQDYVGHWTLKSKIKNYLTKREVVFPAFFMNEETISKYLGLVIKKRPTIIRAFTTPLLDLAKYILDKKINMPQIKGLITTGEPLYLHQRETIEKAFNTKVFDSYRSREGGPIAQECEIHKGLHINEESIHLEIVKDLETEYSDDSGNIVITDLLNYGMPFIRYQMGDIGVVSDASCSCGRGLSLLKKVMGRTADLLKSIDGKEISGSGLVLYLVDEAPGNLGQVQIIQDKYNHLIFKTTDEKLLTEKMKAYQINKIKEIFGVDMQISFQIVEKIPKEKSGKYKFTKYLVE